jgi:DNA-binding winged helix-turn-helix (wHTH) protein/tetratricopeptide (TPR) repeat protein
MPMDTTPSSQSVICFGVFDADVRTGELRKNGVRIKIQELPFRALKLLLSRPNHVFTREEFRQTLWPDGVFVDFDHGISSAINRLRDALGDSASNPIFVETVERRGYRWIAPTYYSEPPRPDPPSFGVEALQDAGPAPSGKSFLHARRKWVFALPVLPMVFLLGIFVSRRAENARAGTPAAASRLSLDSARQPANPEAEDFYLKGRFYWNQRTIDSLNKALDSFTQAIVHDSSYAPAYVGLADCYNLLREYSVMPANEAYPRALAAAKKALELDDQSSEAHASLAFVSFNWMLDAATADREFRRSIELDPKNSVAHHWYATTLVNLARYPESIAEIEHAQALDPASKSILADKGRILWSAGRRDEALSLLKQMETAEPGFMSPHRYLRMAYLDSGDYPDYLAEMKQEALLRHDDAALSIAEAAAKGFSSGGTKGMFREQLREQEKYYALGQVSPVVLAETSALLGNKPEAIKYLQAAYAKHDDHVGNITFDPYLETLHNEPGFRELLAKIGFPPLK